MFRVWGVECFNVGKKRAPQITMPTPLVEQLAKKNYELDEQDQLDRL